MNKNVQSYAKVMFFTDNEHFCTKKLSTFLLIYGFAVCFSCKCLLKPSLLLMISLYQEPTFACFLVVLYYNSVAELRLSLIVEFLAG